MLKKINPVDHFKEIDEEDKRDLNDLVAKILALFFLVVITNIKGFSFNIYKLIFKSSVRFWALIGGQYVASELFKGPAERLSNLLRVILPPKITGNREYLEYQSLYKFFEFKRDSLLLEDQVTILKKLEAARRNLRQGGSSRLILGASSKDYWGVTKDYITTVCAVNDISKEPDFTQAGLQELTKSIDDLLKTYPKISSKIKKYLKPLIDADINKKDYRPRSIFVHGASGVGKTNLITELLKILGFGYKFISIKSVLEGIERENNPYDFSIEDISDVAKAILENSSLAKSKYTVIVCDEADKSFKFDRVTGEVIQDELFGEMLKLTDPKNKHIYDSSVIAHINMKYVIFVFISNKDFIKNTPMARRALKIFVPPLVKKMKLLIAEDHIASQCAVNNITLNKEQGQCLEMIISLNKKPGAGELIEDLKDAIGNMQAEELFKKTSWCEDDKSLFFRFNSRKLDDEEPESVSCIKPTNNLSRQRAASI